MYTIGECTNSSAALCNCIRELSYSIKELLYGKHACNMEKNVRITEPYNSITELSNWIRALSNSF